MHSDAMLHCDVINQMGRMGLPNQDDNALAPAGFWG